jgi:hypothetical protein
MTSILFFDTSDRMTAAQVNACCDLSHRVVVIRYFSRAPAWKTLTDDECLFIQQADTALRKQGGYFLLGIVHEINADPGGAGMGAMDGAYCRRRLAEIGAPPGAWIACAIDEDMPGSVAHQNALMDYVKAFFGELVDAQGKSTVRRALYGPGAALDLAYEIGAIDEGGRWVTQSLGFTGSRASIAAGRIDVEQLLPKRIAGLDADPNIFNTWYTHDPNWTPEQLGFFVPTVGGGMA